MSLNKEEKGRIIYLEPQTPLILIILQMEKLRTRVFTSVVQDHKIETANNFILLFSSSYH